MTSGQSDRQAQPALSLRGLSKSFGAVTALQPIDLDLADGEILAVVGDNGAGKSTLVNLISGVHKPSSGEIRLLGRQHAFTSIAGARNAGVEVVYQDLALVERQPVYMNVFLGRELTSRWLRLLDRKAMSRQAQELLNDLGVHISDVNRHISDFSGGQRQAVAISRAIHWASCLVLLDEPTAALGVAETARVEELIRQLRARKVAVMLISHNLDQVFRLADRIAVLRQGTHVGTRWVHETSSNEIVSMITGLAS
jgi:ABC-type sugar transport system ATPase subunit